MSIVCHNPVDYIRNLQQLLASDKKIIGFLFGAGTSLVKNPKTDKPYVPAIAKMTQLIVEGIKNTPEYYKAIEELRVEFLTSSLQSFTFTVNSPPTSLLSNSLL